MIATEKFEPIKILFITGLHGNEINSNILIDNYLKEAKFNNIIIDKIGPISNFESRDVSFNLNRLDEVNNLFLYAKKMKKLLKKIKEYDIILDSHNTPLCKNIILHSSKEDRNYFKPELDTSMVIWRKSEFDTISEYCRKLGKISFTIETQGMYYIKGQDYKEEFKFLDNTIKLCLELFLNEQLPNKTNELLFTEDNKLRSITLKKHISMDAGDLICTMSGKENIIRIDNLIKGTKEFNDLLNENSLVNIVAPGNNISDDFEGTIEILN